MSIVIAMAVVFGVFTIGMWIFTGNFKTAAAIGLCCMLVYCFVGLLYLGMVAVNG